MIKTLAQGFSGLSFFQNRKKKIFGILVFFFLVSSIPISVYLVKQQQDIRSRAQETPVVFGNSKVSPSTLNFGSLSKSSPKAVKTLTIESLVSTPSATSSGQAPSATPSPTPTEMPTPSPTGVQSTETTSGQITYIEGRVGCDVKEGTTPDEICKQRGFLGAPQTTQDYGSTVAQGFWWKQCGGATLTTCNKLDCNIAQLDCTNTPGEWGTQQPYPQNYLKVGQAQTLYKPDDLGLDCTNYNPGWTMRVACLTTAASSPAPSLGPSSTPTPSPTTTTTETPSNYSLKLKEQTEGITLSFSEDAFLLKPGEQKTLTITLEINPEILKEGSYTNEIILTIDNTSYTIPINFEYIISLLEKVDISGGEAMPTSLEGLTNRLLEESEREGGMFAKSQEERISFLKEIAQRRKELLLKTFGTNTEDALKFSLSKEDRDSLPEEIRNLVEEEKEIRGEMVVYHIDHFEEGRSKYIYLLKEADTNETYNLHFAKNPPKVLSGSEVKIRGVELEKQVALATGSNLTGQTGLLIIAEATLPPVTGEQGIAILLVNFSGNPNAMPITREQITNLVFSTTNSGSLNSYYQENSFRKVSLSGDIFGWYTITSRGCRDEDVLDWGYQAQTKAREAGVDINSFERLIYVFPGSYSCGALPGGIGTIGGNPSESWILYDLDKLRIYAHEFGHNLGLHHANSFPCPLGIYTNCDEQEYGDEFDVMGRRNDFSVYHFNAPHKASVGWLNEVSLKTVAQDGTYTLGPLETLGSNPRVLRIRKPDTNEYYFISYRQAIGFDRLLSSQLQSGASIHIWDEDSFRQTKYLLRGVYTNNYDLALADQKVFYDQANGISIKQIGHTLSSQNQEGDVTVEIEFEGGVSPVPTSPPDYRRVFVTSYTFRGDLGRSMGLGYIDGQCQRLANEKALGGDWKAWISDSSSSPESRFVRHSVPYKLLNGKTIANNWGDLIGSDLQNPINIDENGNLLTDRFVWTGTHPLGFSTQPRCSDWTAWYPYPSMKGVVGTTNSRNFFWTSAEGSPRSCGLNASLYCFEQTPIPTSGLTTLSFSLKIPGIGSGERENRNPVRQERNVNLSILNTGRNILRVLQSSLRFDGNNYTGSADLGNLISGSYYISVKFDNSLSKLFNNGQPIIISLRTPIATQSATLIMGDVNNDNVINISDFGLLRPCFFKNTSSPGWNTCQAADFNDDGRISVTDYSRLITNFGRRGE